MKKSVFLFSTLLALCPASLQAAHAQTPAPAAPPATPAPLPARADAFRAYSALSAASAEPSWLDQKISVDISDATVADAVQKVLDAANVKDATVTPEFTLPADVRVTVKANNIAARDALAAVARFGGALAYITTSSTINNDVKQDKTTVTLRKRTVIITPPVITTPRTPNLPGNSGDLRGRIQSEVERALATGQAYSYYLGGSSRLPNKTVSLDVKNKDVRDALKDVLKQASLDYALEDDVPENVKKSFTFENVPIATALDVICGSAQVGWRAEAVPLVEGQKAANRKYVVRIGKKYAGRRLGGAFEPLEGFAHDAAQFGLNAAQFGLDMAHSVAPAILESLVPAHSEPAKP